MLCEHETSVEQTRQLLCAESDPYHGHLFLPENFTLKHLEPVTFLTISERERAQRFENLFKPGPDNPLIKRRALAAAAAPAPNSPAATPNQNAPANTNPPSSGSAPVPQQLAGDPQQPAAANSQQSSVNPQPSGVDPHQSLIDKAGLLPGLMRKRLKTQIERFVTYSFAGPPFRWTLRA